MLDQFHSSVRRGPPKPSRILQPRAFAPVSGVERFTVPGAGALLVSAAAGDRVSLCNDEGGQPCEIVAADRYGNTGLAMFAERCNSDAAATRDLLTRRDLQNVRAGLAGRGIDVAAARALRVFSVDTPAGAQAVFTAQHDGYLLIAAPGGMMAPGDQNTATAITVTLHRAMPSGGPRFELPEPLADPMFDLRVASATAHAYLVKAGDYLQIIDVDGRQCTDFQCFDARKLDRGVQQPLDVTTTRSLTGQAYAMPGLHSKYYDHDMTALVEVVQDTCGRHDAFALACAAKYYDDIGYPGHPNCSENFNAALAPHGVTPRAGWMAVNLFFNTAIDAQGVVISDEPWSRPGDYVLMRALTDIVCVSSACPDDTSPANGWDLTDIHVRTYSGAQTFKRSVAIRTTPDSDPQMTTETAFHDRFARLTRSVIPYKGYWLPDRFAATGPIAEYWACREKVAVMDLSPLRKFEVTGPDAEALLQYVLTRDVKRLAVGQVVYSAMCYEHGGMLDDGTLFRLGRDNFRWIGGDDYGGVWLRDRAEKLGLKVLVRGSTDQLHNLAVQGPLSRDLMGRVIWTPPAQPSLAELGWFRFTIGRIGGPEGVPVVVSRTGYTGELGYEVWCHPKHGGQVFDAVWEAGAEFGLAPLGFAALDMLRIEAGLIFAGHDFSDQTDPFEAGIGFTVPLKGKPDDFIGRDALIRRKEHPARRMVGLTIDAAVDVGHGDGVFVGRAKIGEVTSATRSPMFGSIALARLDVAHAALGTAVEVGKLDGQQKRLPAEVVALPHYDPKKTRPQS